LLRIAIPVNEKREDASISEDFKKAKYFALVDVREGKTIRINYMENKYIGKSASDISVYLAGFCVNVLLTQGINERDVKAFERVGISIEKGFKGPLNDALKEYLKKL